MSTFDIILIVIMAGFIINGLFKGLIRTVGRIIGLVVGAYVASHFYLVLFNLGKGLANGHDDIAKIIAFIVLFVVAAWVVDLFFLFLQKTFKLLAIIPGSKYIDNLLGAVFGFLEGAIFIGLILLVISKYSMINTFFGDQITNSKIAPFLVMISKITEPLLSQALLALKSLI